MSCAINPVTGKRELSLISEQEEIALGKQTDREIKAQYGIYSDQALNAYVQRVGQRMTPLTHRPHLTYHFAVLDTPVVNAFAVPGGYVYVTRGILALMNSEAELAVVLGHELGHVNARHSIAKLSQLMLAQLGLGVAGVISETFAKLSGAASIGIQLLFLKFSRDDEREADTLGVEYSRKSGYNPGEMINFFASLERLGDLSGGQSLPGFLSTHPLTSERIQHTKDMLMESDRQLKIEKNGYLGAVNNMVYGQDPRQGYVKKNGFIYTFLALSAQNEFSKYDGPFQSVVGSFQELRDARYLNQKPRRIRLVKANGKESLEAISQKAGMAKDLWPKFAIMNQMELGSTPKSGQIIKITR